MKITVTHPRTEVTTYEIDEGDLRELVVLAASQLVSSNGPLTLAVVDLLRALGVRTKSAKTSTVKKKSK